MIVVQRRSVPQPPPPRSAPVPPARLAMEWRSWAGEVWQIADRRSPVYALQGAVGLGMADPSHHLAESAILDGAVWDDAHTPPGEVILPVRVDGPSLPEFTATRAAFLRSLRPEHESVLRVTTPDGRWRQLRCRYRTGANEPLGLDPHLTLSQTFPALTFVAADPFWEGEPVEVVYRYQPEVSSFFPGPPWRLGFSRSLANAWVRNPGDVPAYPRWRVTGPLTRLDVGVGDSVVQFPWPLPAGAWVDIDTAPLVQRVTDQWGGDLRDFLARADFSAIPPGAEVEVVTAIEGAEMGTEAVMSFAPRYRSAW